MRWQWHQLDCVQIICTSLHTDNDCSVSSLNFSQAGCSSWRPTNGVKAPKTVRVNQYKPAACTHFLSEVFHECLFLADLSTSVHGCPDGDKKVWPHHADASWSSLASSPPENQVQTGYDSLQVPTRISADIPGWRLSGNLRHRRQETSSVRSHWDAICTQDNDHAGDEKFRGCWPSHLKQFPSRCVNRNSLPSDVRSTFEGHLFGWSAARLRTIYDALYKSTHHHHHLACDLVTVIDVVVTQDDTWTDIQRVEAVYGDESEAVWQLYSAVQAGGPEVSLMSRCNLTVNNVRFVADIYSSVCVFFFCTMPC